MLKELNDRYDCEFYDATTSWYRDINENASCYYKTIHVWIQKNLKSGTYFCEVWNSNQWALPNGSLHTYQTFGEVLSILDAFLPKKTQMSLF